MPPRGAEIQPPKVETLTAYNSPLAGRNFTKLGVIVELLVPYRTPPTQSRCPHGGRRYSPPKFRVCTPATPEPDRPGSRGWSCSDGPEKPYRDPESRSRGPPRPRVISEKPLSSNSHEKAILETKPPIGRTTRPRAHKQRWPTRCSLLGMAADEEGGG